MDTDGCAVQEKWAGKKELQQLDGAFDELERRLGPALRPIMPSLGDAQEQSKRSVESPILAHINDMSERIGDLIGRVRRLTDRVAL